MFVAIVFGIISPPLPPSLFSGLVRFVLGALIYFCLFRIMRVLMDALSLYASYRSVRLRVLLDAQQHQAGRIEPV